uniref:leucine--tRNA ligase n=1 Tax=Alexandrium monilatum TaxID=311494 RepID=A0A7S4SR08_9DINO
MHPIFGQHVALGVAFAAIAAIFVAQPAAGAYVAPAGLRRDSGSLPRQFSRRERRAATRGDRASGGLPRQPSVAGPPLGLGAAALLLAQSVVLRFGLRKVQAAALPSQRWGRTGRRGAVADARRTGSGAVVPLAGPPAVLAGGSRSCSTGHNPVHRFLPRLRAGEQPVQENWTRRDQLLRIEAEVQALWSEQKVYEVDAPPSDDGVGDVPKFFVTFPYPYMNGKLHLGHAFSITKAEFAARFMRLNGRKVLFPFAFHCTGMPISAAAMKLQAILDERANGTGAPEEQEPVPVLTRGGAEGVEDGAASGVFRAKKSKVQAKTGGLDQYDIMVALGIDEQEIPKFTEPEYWLQYFPPLAVQDLKRLGVAVDWRRSFITTDMNPYYDAFVRWQFQKLREKYLDNGKRESIFSIATNQPCADHDRAEGEGVKPMEYTLIKLKVLEVPGEWAEALGEAQVFLVAATLRPETMYGQTNCFVLPEGEYGFFRMSGGEVFVCSKRSALNMCYQGLGEMQEAESGEKEPVMLLEKTGKDLVGLPLRAPLAAYETVFALPMLTISMEKGTGIVTSVPAEAPDDFACLNDWKTRDNWREQFGVKEEWCMPYDVVEILEIPESEFGKASAPYICEKLKINSHKEKDKLAAAKKEVYMKGFYSGVLTVGPYAGQKVMDVKQQIKEDMLADGTAERYFEPEAPVVARSGDECIVALCDQWYVKYGDEHWTERVRAHVEKDLNMFSEAALNNISYAVGWLGDWACSRTFGLGSKLPWDEQWLIESLSDSTIYMAYYTVAHMLQGSMSGDSTGTAGVPAEALTEEVLDYVFCLRKELPASTAISEEVLQRMRREFAFWYPVDLRCSGRDLVQNHLTMSLFTHAAVWEDSKLWPQAFYCNGHVMVDAEKMSKSKGNFLTLDEAIGTYSADATRIACADSGDGLQDANFSRETAAKSILRLTTLQSWAEDAVARLPTLRTGSLTFLDEIFDNEISTLIERAHEGYTSMVYSDALRAVWFDMENLRSQYSILTHGDVHADLIRRFLDVQMVTLSPIAPHFCEYLWRNVLGKQGLVIDERWPSPVKAVDKVLARQYELIQGTLRSFRLELDKFTSPKKKKKKKKSGGGGGPPPKPTRAVIFVAKEYKPFQQDILRLLQQFELDEENSPVDKGFMRTIKDSDVMKAMPKTDIKKAMMFASFTMGKEVKARGPEALELELPFDEAGMLQSLLEVIKRQLAIEDIEVADAGAEHPLGGEQKRLAAGPGTPQVAFFVEEPAPA